MTSQTKSLCIFILILALLLPLAACDTTPPSITTVDEPPFSEEDVQDEDIFEEPIISVIGTDLSIPSGLEPITPENATQLERLTTFGKGAAQDFVWRNDGLILAVASRTGLYLYETESFTELSAFPFTENLYALTFSPGGEQLAGMQADGTVFVYQTNTGQLLVQLENPDSSIGLIALSADGQFLAAAYGTSYADNTFTVWDIETGQPTSSFTTGVHGLHSLAFSPDSAYLISGHEDTIIFWDPLTGTLQHQQAPLSNNSEDDLGLNYSALTFAPLSGTMATGNWRGEIWLWNIQNLSITSSYGDINFGQISSLSIIPDEQLLAAGAVNGTITIWDFSSRQIASTLNAGDHVSQLSFTPQSTADGWQLAAISDGEIQLWRSGEDLPYRHLHQHQSAIHHYRFYSSGEYDYIETIGSSILRWNLSLGKYEDVPNLPETGFYDTAISPDQSLLAAVLLNSSVLLLDLQHNQQITAIDDIFDIDERGLSSYFDGWIGMAIDPNNQFLATRRGPDLNLWDIATGELITRFPHQIETLLGIFFDPAGQFFGIYGHTRSNIGQHDSSVLVWDTETGNFVIEYPFQNGIDALSINQIQPSIAVGTSDYGTNLFITNIYEIGTWRALNSFQGSNPLFSPNGQYLATQDSENIYFYETGTGNLLSTLAVSLSRPYDKVKFTFSPTQPIALFSDDAGTYLVDIESGAILREFHTPDSLAFSPDGTFLLLTNGGITRVVGIPPQP